MAEKDVASTVDEKDYEHHLTWRGWLSFIVIALSFSGVLKDMGPLRQVRQNFRYLYLYRQGRHRRKRRFYVCAYPYADRYFSAGLCARG